MSATGNRTQQHRLVLLGNTAVGKSSLVLQFVKGQFLQFQEPTIGASFLTQSVTVEDVTVKFEIWDTAGQERYRSLAPMYYRGAEAAVVVYDVTCEESFFKAKDWIEELRRHSTDDIVIVLVGNKVDLATESRVVDAEMAEKYSSGDGFLFLEASAKTNFNVNEIFINLARELIKRGPRKGSGVREETLANKKETSKTCC